MMTICNVSNISPYGTHKRISISEWYITSNQCRKIVVRLAGPLYRIIMLNSDESTVIHSQKDAMLGSDLLCSTVMEMPLWEWSDF